MLSYACELLAYLAKSLIQQLHRQSARHLRLGPSQAQSDIIAQYDYALKWLGYKSHRVEVHLAIYWYRSGNMLSAFQAQAIHELKPKDKSKIDSLLAYGDRLLVGLSTGILRVYRVNEEHLVIDEHNEPVGSPPRQAPGSPRSKQKVVELLREEEKFSKKPIQQLAIVKEANLLVSLSDGYISFHDLQSYTLIERLESTKGALCFAVTSNVIKDTDTSIPTLISRLVVGAKRKLMCWTWTDMELASNVVEITMEGAIKSLTWATDTRLAVGMDAGFSMIDIMSEEVSPINKPASRLTGGGKDESQPGDGAGPRFAAVSSSGMGYMGMSSWVPKPMCTRVSGDELLFAKDVNSLFTDRTGKPSEKRQVPWSHAPEAIGFSYPYLLALQQPERGALQIRNPDTLNLLQNISLPQATILHVPQPRISLAHAGKGFLVASERVIWRMNALSYPSQIEELVNKAKYDEAVSLLQLLEDTLIDDKYGRIREVQTKKGESLFYGRKYRPALDLFTDARTAVDRVVRLYPRSIAGDLTSIPFADDTADEASLSDNASVKPDSSNDVTPATPTKSRVGRLKSAQTPQKQSTDTDGAWLVSNMRADADNASIRSSRTPLKAKPVDEALEGDDLKQAVRALCSFLAQSRVQIQKYLNTSGKLKETPQLDPETQKPAFANLLPQSLFAGKGPWQVDYESELLSTAKLVDTTLFKSYMLASPSLAGPLFRLDNFCDPEVVQTALYETGRYGDLLDFLHGKRLHRQSLEILQKFGKGDVDGEAEVPEGLDGPDRSIAYLKQLPSEQLDLILEYIQWPLQKDPALALTVFTADSDNAEHMDRRKIVEFLAERDHELEQQYLEHLIEEWHEEDDQFHQRLIELYVDDLKVARASHESQAKLEQLLKTSSNHDRHKTLRLLDVDNVSFYESRAIVLTALGDYKQALAIYVYKLHDYAQAEAHCARIYLRQTSAKETEERAAMDEQLQHINGVMGPTRARASNSHSLDGDENVFAVLLGLYLRPQQGEPKRWPEALELLSNHGSRLPPSSTLDLVPDDLAVQQLHDYFKGQMRRTTSLLREDSIVKGLESVRRVRAEGNLLMGKDCGRDTAHRPQGRNARIVVKDGDHCKVCHKRFGAYAVRSWPDGSITHYGCVPGRSEKARGW